MSWFILLLLMYSIVRLYSRWLGYWRLFTHGPEGSPFDTVRDWTWKPKVTFMIPSFNEGVVVTHSIESIMASDYPKEQIEILAADDCSTDDTWMYLQQMAAKYPNNVIAWKNEPNKGKPLTLVDMVRKATGEIVITVDSDTIIAPDALKQLISCYADPEMGGVCGFVRIKNLNASLWTQMQGVNFGAFYYLTKILENQTKTSRCMCGPLASFRRHIFLECVPLILNREFLGTKPIQCGEDAYLTTRVTLGDGIEKRWKMFNNFEALAWTDNPFKTDSYLKQQLRWWRGSMLTGSYVLVGLFRNFQKAGIIPTAVTILTVVGIIILFLSLIFLWFSGNLLETFATTLIMVPPLGATYCVFYNYFIGRHDPVAGKVKNPILVGFTLSIFSILSWVALAITSICTMDDGGWVTRQAGKSNVS